MLNEKQHKIMNKIKTFLLFDLDMISESVDSLDVISSVELDAIIVCPQHKDYSSFIPKHYIRHRVFSRNP